MRTISFTVIGGIAYFAGYQWDVIPVTLSSITVIVMFYLVVAEIWSDPVPSRRQKAQLKQLAENVEPRVKAETREEILLQITDRPSEIDPEVMLSELLGEDDQEWLKHQVEMIVKEESR